MEIKEINLKFFVDVLARNLLAIGIAVAVCVALALVYCHYAPRTYISKVTLMPEETAPDPMAALGVLGSTLGLTAGGGSQQFSELYLDVVKSRGFLKGLLDRKVRAAGRDTTAAEFYGLAGDEERRRIFLMGRELHSALKLTKLSNGLIAIELETEDAEFSASLLNAIVADLEAFFEANERRKMERSLEFMRGKIAEKELLYKASSNRLAEFISQNQYLDFQKTPKLYNTLEELKRDQRIQEEIYLLLVKEFEKSQIENEKDKAIIQVLDYAEPALQKDKPYRVKITASALLGSFLLAYGLLLVRERLKTAA